MSFNQEWFWPEGHPVSVDRAKELMRGDLGRYHYEILARICSPLYWHFPDDKGVRRISANGTLSYVQSEERVFGVTAAHVVNGYLKEEAEPGCVLQLGNAVLSADVIDIDEKLDLATLRLCEATLAAVGKEIMPVSLCRSGDIPQEGRGIMMCGYIGEERRQRNRRQVDWGMLGVVGVARRVSDEQITWIPDHENHVSVPGVPQLTRNKDLGGISGGPLIAWFERPKTYLSYFSLAGVIKEANAELEYVVASRSHFIRADGKIDRSL